MKRRYVYPGEIPRALDFLDVQKNTLVGLARLGEDLLFGATDPANATTKTLVAGFAPTYPGGLSLGLARGNVYTMAVVDSGVFGDAGTDTRVVLHQGEGDASVVTVGAAPGAGLSRIDLIQVQRIEADQNPAVLLYYNSANTAQALLGPGGLGTPEYLDRAQAIVISVKAGTAAASPVAPTADAGWSPLFLVTVPNGTVNLTSGNVAVDPLAPFVAGLTQQHHTGAPGSAPKIDLTTEVQGLLPTSNLAPLAITDTTGNLPTTRISGQLPASQVDDSFATGTDVQAYMDARRNYRGVVANVAARNALTNLANGDWVVILDNGSGDTEAQWYELGTLTWAAFSGTGGGGTGMDAKIHGPFTMIDGQTVVTLPETYDIVGKVLHVLRDGVGLYQNVHWTPTTTTTFTFSAGFESFAGEQVLVLEFEPGTGGGGGPSNYLEELASGTVDSTDGVNGNGTFTVTTAMLLSPAPQVLISGAILLTAGVHYNISGNQVIFVSGAKPTVGESVLVKYYY
jgi:hypothetical protein